MRIFKFLEDVKKALDYKMPKTFNTFDIKRSVHLKRCTPQKLWQISLRLLDSLQSLNLAYTSLEDSVGEI